MKRMRILAEKFDSQFSIKVVLKLCWMYRVFLYEGQIVVDSYQVD